MGGHNANRPRTLLKGKSNYAIWVPACQMELRTEECLKALTVTPKVDPNNLFPSEVNDRASKWLARREELSDNGFSTQKITANRAK